MTITRSSDNFYPVGSAPRALLAGQTPVRGVDSNVVMSPVQWVMRTFTEATAIVQRRADARVWEHVVDHPMELLIGQPNKFYDGDALWKATVMSYQIDGNAYWLKVRNVYGDVIALWYIPHWLIRPNWSQTSDEFIQWYDYTPGLATPQTAPFKIAVRDVVHFRFGLDPDNPRYGFSPLRAVLNEVLTDDDAADFSRTILGNTGAPGLMVSPKGDGFRPTEEQAQKLKEYLDSAFVGDYRGGALVSRFPTEVTQFGFDANRVTLSALRDLSEERVCASMGIPAAVVGFGSGLQSTKVGATMRELRRLAWVQCLLPMQKALAKQLTIQLLPDFHGQLRRFRVRFDDSDVSAFQEDDDLFTNRVTKMATSGLLRVDRAQAMLGLEVDPTQKVYIRPANTIVVDENGNAVAQSGAGDGTGDGAGSSAHAGEEADGGADGAVAGQGDDTLGDAEQKQQDLLLVIARRAATPFDARTWRPTNRNGHRNGSHA